MDRKQWYTVALEMLCQVCRNNSDDVIRVYVISGLARSLRYSLWLLILKYMVICRPGGLRSTDFVCSFFICVLQFPQLNGNVPVLS